MGNQNPYIEEEQTTQWPKEELKIPKGQSESVYRRRTDNTMAKRRVEETKGVIRIRISKMKRQHNDLMFEDTKGVNQNP